MIIKHACCVLRSHILYGSGQGMHKLGRFGLCEGRQVPCMPTLSQDGNHQLMSIPVEPEQQSGTKKSRNKRNNAAIVSYKNNNNISINYNESES